MQPVSIGRTMTVLFLGLDVLMVGLVALAVGAAIQSGASPGWTSLAGAALMAVYLVGRFIVVAPRQPLEPPARRRWGLLGWLLLLIGLWLVLLTLTAMAVWVSFPLMLIALHALGPRSGIAMTVAIVGVAIGYGVMTTPQVTAGTVLGPLVGAAVAVAVVLGLEALANESEQRQQLVEELTRARNSLVTAERERAVLGERERLAREIHDTLAQGFSGIELLLRAAQTSITDPAASQLVDRAGETARQNLTEARRFVRALGPADLADHDLVDAMRRTTDRVTGPELVAQTEVIGNPTRCATSTEAALLRIAQSSVTNAVQHAAASHITVTLRYTDDLVSVTITDDGRGFDPDTPTDGFGLRGMRSRVAELDGRFSVTSCPGRGTTITAELPLEAR